MPDAHPDGVGECDEERVDVGHSVSDVDAVLLVNDDGDMVDDADAHGE